MKSVFFLFVAFVISSPFAYSQNWKIAKNHKIAFSNSDVSGVFKEISGTIHFDAANLDASKFHLKIKVESINTGNTTQNKHALGGDWFDALMHPEIEFISDKIKKTDKGFVAIGKLIIRGFSKECSIPFTFEKKGSKGTFVAKFSINRAEYGVGKSESEESDNMSITATLPVTKIK